MNNETPWLVFSLRLENLRGAVAHAQIQVGGHGFNSRLEYILIKQFWRETSAVASY